MSYVLTPYVIDLEKLRAAVGSRDAGLIAAIRANDPARFDSSASAEGLTAGAALTHLIQGQIPAAPSAGAHQYGYALELLANHLGRVILPDLWGGVRWAAVEDSGLEPILSTGAPLPLPPYEDFPVIGHLSRDPLADMVHNMGDEGLTHDDDELEELLKEFESWLRTAAAEMQDLLLFYY